MPDDHHSPEWVPADKPEGHVYASHVMPGVTGGHAGMPDPAQPTAVRNHGRKRRVLSVEDYVAGIAKGDRITLARAITLLESSAPKHLDHAQEVLRQCMERAGRSLRIGITGTPGAGKSTFIEAFGKMLCEQGHRVAVLAVDPTSSRTGGSILGDKTRMEQLGREANAFIRPSPARGALGGVAAKTREAMLLCEAAGFDVILVETVGVGQSEVKVRSMVDFFLVLQIAGAGDELQGMKKGVIELADAIAVNKADGDNEMKARAAKGEYNRVLHYLQPATPGWQSRAVTCSALTGKGIPEIWQLMQDYVHQTQESGEYDRRRQRQNIHWLHALIEDGLKQHFHADRAVAKAIPDIEAAVGAGEKPVTQAVLELLALYHQDA